MDRDPDVTRFVKGPWADPAAHRAFVEERTRGPYPAGLGYWTILRRGDEQFLGWVLLIPLDAEGPEIEIGWRLVRAEWGKGYATEAVARILRHAFADLGLPEVVADIAPANVASIRLAQKIGLRPRSQVPHGDQAAIRYAVTSHEYTAHG